MSSPSHQSYPIFPMLEASEISLFVDSRHRLRNPFVRTTPILILSVLLALSPVQNWAAEEAAAAGVDSDGGNNESANHPSETIVSEKDAVNLVKDSSVAEAVKRRPDLSFANVQIDGESSGISLSNISAEDVASVEVMKAVTPDLDADTRGGSISLKTRPTYDQKKTITSVEASWTYDSIDAGQGYRGRLSYSGPLNEARTLGAKASVSYRNSHYRTETLYQDWQTASIAGTEEFVLRDNGFGTFVQDSDTLSYNATLDYKATDQLNFFWRASADNRDYQTAYDILKYRFFRGDYLSVDSKGANVEAADIRNSIWRYSTRSDEAESTLGGAYKADNLLIDFKFTYKDDEVEYTKYFTADFVQDDLDLRYDLEDPKFPTTTITNDKQLKDAPAYRFEDLDDRHYLGVETDTIGAVNVKWDDLFGNQNLFLKVGYKTRARDNSRDSQYNIYDAFNGTFTLADALSNKRYPDLLDGRYNYDFVPDGEAAEKFYENNQDNFILSERRTRENSDPNTYSANESVDAYYAMLNLVSGKWRSILGLRNESTAVDFIGNEVVLGKNALGETVYLETNPVFGDSTYDNFFPNAHFRYQWSDSITVIGSFTNTIERPRYTYLVPYRRVNLEEMEIDEGNPELKPTLYTNYDLSVDFVLPAEAMLSVELFNRSVEDFVFTRKQIIAGGIYQGFELERFENSSSADIQGATLTWRQTLQGLNLPPGLSLNANYTKQKSEIEYPARPGEILPLAQTPDTELKLTLSYQNEKFFAQVRYAYEDLMTTRVAENREEDIYLLSNGQIDLSFTYQLKKNIRLFTDVRNITNEPSYDRYEGSVNRPAGFRYLPWTLSSGVRFEL